VIYVADIDRAIFSDCEVVAPINLAVVIAEATPLGEDFSGEIELKKFTTIGSRGLEVAPIDYVQQIVGSDGERPGAAKLR
jgi:hypothetical protein